MYIYEKQTYTKNARKHENLTELQERAINSKKRSHHWRSQPKNLRGAKKFWGEKCLISGEQHYFLGKNASQSTKRLFF